VDLNKNYAELTDDALATYATTVREAFDAITVLEAPSEAQVSEAEGYADHLDAIGTEQGKRVEAAAKLAARTSALRNRFSDSAPEAGETAEEGTEEEDAVEEEDSEEEDAHLGTRTVHQPPGTEQSRSTVVALARKVSRPAKPAATRVPVTITAAADVPDFATGSKLNGLETVATAVVNRMRGFGAPSGDGVREDLRHVGVASFRLDFPAELTIDRHSDDMEVLALAARESRLPGGSLVAAGGWCAPSETIYDLCAGETAEGLASVPEVNVARGGIKYTTGPDFSTIYSSVGFCQTEAQAIAGATKTCIDVVCPAFVEVRLDACGICVKAPILTNAAYPELVQRYVSGSMVAHQHKMNAKVLNSIAAGSTAKTFSGLGATATDTWDGLTIYADQIRQKYRLGITSSLEVIVPFWVRDALRADISRRNAIDVDTPVTDAILDAEFALRHLAVQYVYDWQELPYADVTGPPAVDSDAWPKTFDALMYPAGAWVKGTADVINLNAVYDAASLATNTYTALFFEQGILTAKMCYDSVKVTLPVCSGGRSGISNLTCA
jgi:hypothetical protein